MIHPARILLLVPLVLGLCGVATAEAKPPKPAAKKVSKPSKPPGRIKRELFAGRVVMLSDALKRRGVKSTDEFAKQVVLETPGGELIPIVPDWRGRAFYQDKRLRNRPVELVGYRRRGIPYLQVLMVFTIDRTDKRQKKSVRRYFDYWCDICSIPMYEIKRCECCQGPIRMRFQPRGLPSYIKTDTKAKAGRETSANGDISP